MTKTTNSTQQVRSMFEVANEAVKAARKASIAAGKAPVTASIAAEAANKDVEVAKQREAEAIVLQRNRPFGWTHTD